MTGSTITGNTSKSIERHIGSSYKVVLAVSKKLDDIVRIGGSIEDNTFQDVAANLDTIIVVRNDIENVNIVAGTINDVVVVSSNIDDVVTVSTNMADVLNASSFVDDIHTSVNAAAVSATAAELSNQQSATNAATTTSDKNIVAGYRSDVEADRAEVAADRVAVTSLRNEVELDRQEVAANTATVSADKAIVAGYKDVTLTAKTEAQRWATGISGSGVNTPSDTNNAFYFSEQAAASASEAAASAATIDEELIKYDATSIAIVQLASGKLELIKDAFGNAHLFGVWPIQTYEQLQIPNCPFTGVIDVFRKQDGTFRSECRIAIHKSVNVGGRTVSRSGLAPYVNLNFDEFKTKASDLSGGFRMLDVYHDAFINWQILSIIAKGGQQPRGNTEWGRAHDMISEVGRRVDGMLSNERTGNGATLTGSGPDSWRHDGTTFGVSDWVGNVWEWVDGFKTLGGQFYVAEYSGQPEAQWLATGRYINSGHIFSMTPPPSPVASNQTWGLFTKSADYSGHELLQRLLIEPIDCTKVLSGRFYYNTDGERFPVRRGHWYNAGDAGPAALHLGHPRSNRNSYIGGRLAFVS